MTEDLRYPIGKYIEQPFSEDILQEWLLDIETLPQQIEYAVVNLDEAQLDTPYREGGWTVKQLVHHVADSHMNAYIRFKLGLTEDNPMIKAYDENEWAKMADTQIIPINISITLLYALHCRWSAVLSSISVDQWNRKVYHSEHKREMTLWFLLGMYAWHSRHHTAHITRLRDRMSWW
ncbi:MAG: putative metal-dependent hydrolase [Ferruginibacter sp.]